MQRSFPPPQKKKPGVGEEGCGEASLQVTLANASRVTRDEATPPACPFQSPTSSSDCKERVGKLHPKRFYLQMQAGSPGIKWWSVPAAGWEQASLWLWGAGRGTALGAVERRGSGLA